MRMGGSQTTGESPGESNYRKNCLTRIVSFANVGPAGWLSCIGEECGLEVEFTVAVLSIFLSGGGSEVS